MKIPDVLLPKAINRPKENAVRLKPRDMELFETIYDFDGIMSKRQIRELFWSGFTRRAMEKRLSKLFHGEYLYWPPIADWRSKPIPEPVCWLGWKGIMLVADRKGVKVATPREINENQLRRLENELRDHGIHWLREPRWIQLEHDLVINDFRLAVQKEVGQSTTLRLGKWLTDSTFHADMDVIEFEAKSQEGKFRTVKKGIRPDGYFELFDEKRQINGSPATARFLLEIDLSTHDNPSFGREKVVPGVAYIKSPEFKQRFGYNSGRWLVVTTGKTRMKNLMAQTILSAGAGAKAFLFTTFEHLANNRILSDPVWQSPGVDHPLSLFVVDRPTRGNLNFD